MNKPSGDNEPVLTEKMSRRRALSCPLVYTPSRRCMRLQLPVGVLLVGCMHTTYTDLEVSKKGGLTPNNTLAITGEY